MEPDTIRALFAALRDERVEYVLGGAALRKVRTLGGGSPNGAAIRRSGSEAPVVPACVQIPEPPSNTSSRSGAWLMKLPAGTLRVSQTLPPMLEPRPMVMRPRMVAPA